jgi:secernin
MESCDTFVALGDVTTSGNVIFGKNSDRPHGEVQEVVRVQGLKHQRGSKLQVI